MEPPVENLHDGINPDELLLVLAYRRCSERRQIVIRTFVHRLAYREGPQDDSRPANLHTAVVIPLKRI